jgi:hypothetical protein
MTNSITFTLDETYCCHLEDSKGRLRRDARLEIPFYGEVQINYDSENDWEVVGITLCASNGKSGAQCEGWEEPISKSHPFWRPIERYLQEIAIDDVFEQISVDIASRFADYQFQRGKDKARGLLY